MKNKNIGLMTLGALLIPSAALVLPSCNNTKDKPNIVFILTDQWRAMSNEFEGNEDIISPNLVKLSTESIVFSTAISNCPVCSPARASLLTGQYPLSHGVFYNDKPLTEDNISIADALKSDGYSTAYIGKWHVNGHISGTNNKGRRQPVPLERRQGFDFWKVHECTHDYNNSVYFDEENVKHKWKGYDAIAQTDMAIDYISKKHENPFFLLLSFGPPHAPYQTAPEKYRKLYENKEIHLRKNVPDSLKDIAIRDYKGYYAHMSALDDCIGRIQNAIKEKGLEKNTLFIFTSDHGDMLYSHSQVKKQKPWDESIRVPLLMKYPKIFKPRNIKTPFSIPDIMPTILGLLNIEIPESVEGLDYSKLLTDNKKMDVKAALITCPVPFHQWSYELGGREYRGIRTERYTYAKDLRGPWVLYDNEEDPFQLNNLVNSPEHQDLQQKMETILQDMLTAKKDLFKSGEYYMEEWDYSWDNNDSIKPVNIN